MTTSFWRKWHRWIGFPSVVFLIFAAATGVIVTFTEFFGADETQREALRKLVSPVMLAAPPALGTSVEQAFATAARTHANAPVEKLEVQFKGARPTVTIYTEKPRGGEDRKLVFDAATGAQLSDEAYEDKPFLYRLHSGEAFGDGGLVVSMFWGLALVAMALSGFFIYWHMVSRMRVRHEHGWRRFFW